MSNHTRDTNTVLVSITRWFTRIPRTIAWTVMSSWPFALLIATLCHLWQLSLVIGKTIVWRVDTDQDTFQHYAHTIPEWGKTQNAAHAVEVEMRRTYTLAHMSPTWIKYERIANFAQDEYFGKLQTQACSSRYDREHVPHMNQMHIILVKAS